VFNENSIVYQNGEFVVAKDANTNLFSQTLHYGIGVFEGMRSYPTQDGPPVIFKLEEHLNRLFYSSARMGIQLNVSLEDLKTACNELLRKNRLSNAYIRPLVYLGRNMSFRKNVKAHVFIAAWQWGKLFGDDLLNVGISTYRKQSPKSIIIDAKVVGHYTNSSLATNEAVANGFDSAILLDENGFVAQGAAANFFYERDNVLYTPMTNNIFPGITRETIIDLAGTLNISVEEKNISLEELELADAAFFTGTAAEVSGIKSIGNNDMGYKWEDSSSYFISCKYHQLVRQQDIHQSTFI